MNIPLTMPASIPPLQDGDRLSRDEFERRYEAMPHVKKAELIEGVVYMGSPVNSDNHGEPHSDMVWVLVQYRVFTPAVRVSDNATVRLDLKNEPQPDAILYIKPECGGQVKKEDGYIVGGPELALLEIAASSASNDLGPKLNAYRRNAVREYVVWRVLDRAVDWFVLRDSHYERLAAQAGVYRSEVFPGLWLDAEAMLRGDLARVHQVLHEGLASKDHQDFVAKLERS